jgi:hypothetical protein
MPACAEEFVVTTKLFVPSPLKHTLRMRAPFPVAAGGRLVVVETAPRGSTRAMMRFAVAVAPVMTVVAEPAAAFVARKAKYCPSALRARAPCR